MLDEEEKECAIGERRTLPKLHHDDQMDSIHIFFLSIYQILVNEP